MRGDIKHDDPYVERRKNTIKGRNVLLTDDANNLSDFLTQTPNRVRPNEPRSRDGEIAEEKYTLIRQMALPSEN